MEAHSADLIIQVLDVQTGNTLFAPLERLRKELRSHKTCAKHVACNSDDDPNWPTASFEVHTGWPNINGMTLSPNTHHLVVFRNAIRVWESCPDGLVQETFVIAI